LAEASVRSYADGCETAPAGYLEAWYVDPDVRRQGVGRALVMAAEAWVHRQGCHEMASDAGLDNTVSQAAHERLGYRETGRAVQFCKALATFPGVSTDDDLTIAIDALIQNAYPSHEPGAAVIAMRNGQTVLRKGYGMAQLELGVPLEPDTVFRIASVSKQFTAVAILMLMEQGLLALNDPLTRFLADYPTHGHIIMVEHLLTHTSGIPSYTSLPAWFTQCRNDVSVEALIALFKDEPLQFAPGTRWAYSDSGYHLLGAIIEQLSGQTYAQFLQERIFTPVGMRQTWYDSHVRIVPHRAAGYTKEPDGYTNAVYISSTQLFATGGLASTVDDLALWDAALSSGALLRPETLQRAWTPYRLANGLPIGYGYGWMVSTWQGRATMEHSGGLPGFDAYVVRVPEERVFVAVLSNNLRDPGPDLLALRIAALLFGQPYEAPAPITLDPAALAAYIGIYHSEDGESWKITLDGSQLVAQQESEPSMELLPVALDTFFTPALPLSRLVFVRDAAHGVSALELQGRAGRPVVARRAGTHG
jgi:CubicO group peptidase (beta-lactamase class C family)